jgi:hypothetical protein
MFRQAFSKLEDFEWLWEHNNKFSLLAVKVNACPFTYG